MSSTPKVDPKVLAYNEANAAMFKPPEHVANVLVPFPKDTKLEFVVEGASMYAHPMSKEQFETLSPAHVATGRVTNAICHTVESAYRGYVEVKESLIAAMEFTCQWVPKEPDSDLECPTSLTITQAVYGLIIPVAFHGTGYMTIITIGRQVHLVVVYKHATLEEIVAFFEKDLPIPELRYPCAIDATMAPEETPPYVRRLALEAVQRYEETGDMNYLAPVFLEQDAEGNEGVTHEDGSLTF